MSKTKKRKKSSSSYMRYSGMGMQMIGLLFVSIWIGGKIDAYFGFDVRYITALLTLLTLVAYFVKLYFDLLRDD